MMYGQTSETDWTLWHVRREFLGICARVEARMSDRLARPPFDVFDWHLIYAPIIMGPEMAPSYPARSRCAHKKRILNCSPQLDQPGYLAGPYASRWRIYVDGLNDTEILMARARFPQDVIGEFRAGIAALAAAPEP